MAKFEFTDLLTKISNVFKYDMYIIDNKYCLGGVESEEKNTTQILCILTQECSELVKEMFPEKNFIFIKNMKEAKKDLENNSNTKLFESEKADLIKRRDKILSIERKVDEWKSFNFTKEQINQIFVEGQTFELFTEDERYPSVMIGKSLFPMVKENGANRLYYHIFVPESSDDLVEMITSFDTDWFQIFNLLQYVQTEK